MQTQNKKTRIFLALIGIILAAANIYVLTFFPREESADIPDPSARLTIRDFPSYVLLGDSHTAEVSVSGSDSGEAMRWSSSDESVLKVDGTTVTAISAGTAALTVISENTGANDSLTVHVFDGSAKAVSDLVAQLSEQSAAPELADEFHELVTGLNLCGNPNVEKQREAVSALEEIAEKGADSGKSCGDIAEALGLDALTVRTAAESLHYRSQLGSGSVMLSFTGDCSLGRINETDYFSKIYSDSGSDTYPFDRVRHIFSTDDLTVINFEGTLVARNAPTTDKKFHIRGEPAYAAMLPASSIELANLANNHSRDYFDTGMMSTVQSIETHGSSVVYAERPYITEINGLETVVLSAGEWKDPAFIDDSVSTLLRLIKEYKRGDNLVIANIHWGAEYFEAPSEDQIKAAHGLIDAGADMVVGHHAHIIQGVELYKGKVIAYSLGNFAFCGTPQLRESETFILRASFSRSADNEVCMNSWCVVPCFATGTGTLENDFRPVVLHGDDAGSMMKVLRSRSRKLCPDIEIPFYTCE